MRHNLTRAMLKQMDQEINSMKDQTPTLFILLSKQIKLFYEKAQYELNVNKSRFSTILDKYVEKDSAGKPLTEPDGEGMKWKFIRSLPDLVNARVLDVSQVESRFTEECKALFEQEITIEL